MKKLLFSIFILSSLFGYNQKDSTNNVTHIHGAIVEGDSLKALPLVHVNIKGKNVGTISDVYGYFSIVANASDTLEFSCIGYHKNQFILPTNLHEDSYSIIHAMVKDTILLKEFTLFPWPTIHEFSTAFINLKLSKEDQERAEKNLSKQNLTSAAENVPLEGSTTYKYELQNRYTRLYLADGFPSLKLLDPLAWNQFIKAWKNGDFKTKK